MNECSKYDTHCILFPIAIQSIEIYFLCIKNPVGALLQNYKKNPTLLLKGEQSLDSSSSACPCHSVPRSAQLWMGGSWMLLSLGGPVSGAGGRSIPPSLP